MVNKNIIEEAVKQSTRSPAPHYRHGAVIFDNKNNIISRGYNHDHYNECLNRYGYKGLSTHAEAAALLRCDNPVGLNLLVVRRSYGGTKVSSSKPCKSCMSLLVDSGIKRVFYSDVDGSIKMIRL